MPRPRHAAVCALVLAAAACSPYLLGAAPDDPHLVTQPFTPYVDGMASVCIIRTARLAMAVTVVVHDNDVLVGATRGPSYFCYRAQPGPHRILLASEDGALRLDVDLEDRGRYYFDQGLDFEFGRVLPRGVWVDEPIARDLVTRSAHRPLQGAPARETLLAGTDVVGASETTPKP